ncbi:hypothetical protein [Thaumasiovibrio sp. DFM-14]|uniref:hypothetical protein n=1 Tax=Thaumasiovibrio sp. DFM-14 TaxID=3384792 RepID=UPI00399F031F
MQQRILRQRLCVLLVSLLLCSVSQARMLSVQQVDAVLDNEQLADTEIALSFIFNQSDTSRITTELATYSPLVQEALKLRLVEYAATLPTLSEPQLTWLHTLAAERPQYQVKQRGQGYLMAMPAFNYSMLAHGVVMGNHRQQEALEAMAAFNQGELTLTDWLNVPLQEYYPRRDIFISHAHELNEEALARLVDEFGPKRDRLLWLADNAVIATLAAHSANDALYDLLWRRRTDAFSVAELERLANISDDTTVLQLIAATGNPSLKHRAFQHLARLQPMPLEVQYFLLAKLDEVEDGSLVASQLVLHGYRDWVQELASGDNGAVRARHLQQALSAATR